MAGLLGRVSAEGRVMSARLNPTVIVDELNQAKDDDEGLIAASIDDALFATQEDVQGEVQDDETMAGGMRGPPKPRGQKRTLEEAEQVSEAESVDPLDIARENQARRLEEEAKKAAEREAAGAGAGSAAPPPFTAVSFPMALPAGKLTKEEEERRFGQGVGARAAPSTGVGAGAPMTTRSRALVGTSLSKQAVQNLIAKLDTLNADAAKAVDTAAAKMIDLIPGAVEATAVGAATTFAISNPSLFGHFVRYLKEAIVGSIQAAPTGNWDEYARTIQNIWGYIGDVGTAVYEVVPNSPVFVISAVLLIMRVRAQSEGISVRQLIAADAHRVLEVGRALGGGAGAGAATEVAGPLLTRAVEVVWTALLSAYTGTRKKVSGFLTEARSAAGVQPLRELAQRTLTRPGGEGAVATAAVVRSTGAPAVRSVHLGDGMEAQQLVPNFTTQELTNALNVLTRIPPPPAESKAVREARQELKAGADTGKSPAKKQALEGMRGLPTAAGPPQPISVPPGRPLGIADARPTPRPSSASAGPTGAGAGEAPPEDVTMTVPGAPAPMDVDKPEEEETKGGRRKTRSKRRKTFRRKKGKKTRGKTRKFIY